MSRLKKIPKFKTLEDEQEFWQSHDSADYIDWSKAKVTQLPELKPSVKTISLRLPEDLLNEIKILANKEDVSYQSLIKMLLAQKVMALMKKTDVSQKPHLKRPIKRTQQRAEKDR